MKTERIIGLITFFFIVFCLFLFCLGFAGAGWWLSRPPEVPTLIFATRPALTLDAPTLGLPTVSPVSPAHLVGPGPHGKIVYVCQVFKTSANDQICIIDADGSNQHRLTTENRSKHFYPSLSPDGLSVVFSSNLSGQGKYDIYEMDLSGNINRLTSELGILTAPEISPDGRQIAFTWSGDTDETAIWVMNRDGSNPHQVHPAGWDPTWSPDGAKILFAVSVPGYGIQLASVNLDGTGFQRVSNLPDIRGRSDWSNDGRWLVTYSGKPWKRELFLMPPDGSFPFQISPAGGNSQGPSFSPDGGWIAFTAYFDLYGDEHGCEIYIVKIDGSGLTRLTRNDFCDWQPRWGP